MGWFSSSFVLLSGLLIFVDKFISRQHFCRLVPVIENIIICLKKYWCDLRNAGSCDRSADNNGCLSSSLWHCEYVHCCRIFSTIPAVESCYYGLTLVITNEVYTVQVHDEEHLCEYAGKSLDVTKSIRIKICICLALYLDVHALMHIFTDRLLVLLTS